MKKPQKTQENWKEYEEPKWEQVFYELIQEYIYGRKENERRTNTH